MKRVVNVIFMYSIYFTYVSVGLCSLVYPLFNLIQGMGEGALLEYFKNGLLNELSAGTLALRITSMYCGAVILLLCSSFKRNFLGKVSLHQNVIYASIALILWYLKFQGVPSSFFTVLLELGLFFVIDDWRIIYAYKDDDEYRSIRQGHRILINIFNGALLSLSGWIFFTLLPYSLAAIFSAYILIVIVIRYTRPESKYV